MFAKLRGTLSVSRLVMDIAGSLVQIEVVMARLEHGAQGVGCRFGRPTRTVLTMRTVQDCHHARQ